MKAMTLLTHVEYYNHFGSGYAGLGLLAKLQAKLRIMLSAATL